MALIYSTNCLQTHFHRRDPISPSPPFVSSRSRFLPAVRTTAATAADGGGGALSSQNSYAADLLKKPVAESLSAGDGDEAEDERSRSGGGGGEQWVDWEDRILEDTVPLVGFVRMILHSGKYDVGDRLSLQHERLILERLLPYHPEYEKKVGSGVDYIMIDYHPNFENSKCMFIVQKDGKLVDFSYWKCIKGLIRQKYPLHADSFILRHFRRRGQT